MSIHSFDKHFYGYTLTGTYEYEPAIPGSLIDPPWGPVITIIDVYINGSKEDAYGMMNPDTISYLEEELAQDHE
jgi:hypothetical protein